MTSYAWAVPGAEVVCIDDNWSYATCALFGIEPPSRVPMINEVLTIREALPMAHAKGGISLSFEELDPVFGFAVVAFRPLVSRTIEQDMAIFVPWLHEKSPEVAQ